jgi:hypothetical protein
MIEVVKMIDPVSVKICLVYDPNDGRIVHKHEVITLRGGKETEDGDVESKAKEMAVKAGHDVSKLKVLHASPKEYSTQKAYKVDTKSLRLIEVTKPV